MTIDTNFIKKFKGDFNQNVKLSIIAGLILAEMLNIFIKLKIKNN